MGWGNVDIESIAMAAVVVEVKKASLLLRLDVGLVS